MSDKPWRKCDLSFSQALAFPCLRRGLVHIVILVPFDFERDDVGEKLVAAGFEQNSAAFFTWLGVVP